MHSNAQHSNAQHSNAYAFVNKPDRYKYFYSVHVLHFSFLVLLENYAIFITETQESL